MSKNLNGHPQMDDQSIEEEIQAKGLTAPRVTPDHIASVILDESYVHVAGTTLTLCLLMLRNGTVVTGESACVNAANFDAELGRHIAHDKAVEKIWALEGYLLAQRMHDERVAAAPANTATDPA